MRIHVCVKHVPDTSAKIRVVGDTGFDESVKFVVNPYDEYAVEEALRVREAAGEGEVVLVSVGKQAAAATLRSALAMGADRAILVKTDAQLLDSDTTARALAKAIESDGGSDLIFAGKQSVDSEGMQTHYRLAAELDLPVMSDVVAFALADGKVCVESEIGGGAREVVEMTLPCVVGVTRGLNEPRYPKLPDIMKAKKKEVREIDIEAGDSVPAMLRLEAAPDRAAAQMLDGAPGEMAERLITLLRDEAKLI